MATEGEDELLRAVALKNAAAITKARQRAEDELIQARDDLERKTAELASSLALIKATLDSVTDGIMVTDRARRVVSYNSQYQRLWGLAPETMQLADHRAILEVVARNFERPEAFLGLVDRICETDPASTFDVLYLLDGRVVERHSRPQKVGDQVIGRVWSFRDITAATRARAEREGLLNELKSWGQRLADIFRQAPAFMCVLRGPHHVFEMVNDRYVQLVGDRRLVGLAVRAAIPEAEGQGFFERLDEVFRTGQAYSAHNALFRARRGAGGELEERLLDFVYLPLRDPDGVVTGVLVHGVDLTERYRAEAKTARLAADLAEADRRKSEFLATLAHELRNPLAPIRNGLEIIRRSPGDLDRVERSRQVMDRQLSHLVRLVDDLLDISRISQGKLELERQVVSLQSVVAAAVETGTATIEAQHHRLTVELPAEPLMVDADPHRLAQVITNLLNNAARYTPAAGNIELRATMHGNEFELQVRDDGIGIEPGSLSRIFDMFTQVQTDAGRSKGGLGIGLSLARMIVTLHGGRITASSEGPGRGSQFSIWLPATASAAPVVAEPEPPRSADLATTRSLSILVVDDNEDAAATLGSILEMEGHRVRIAHDGRQALAVAGDFVPQLVFLDLGLPDMSGYQVARSLRSMPRLGQVILVALTGWGAEGDRLQSMQAGFDRHLTKPLDLRQLDELLARVALGALEPPPWSGAS